MRHLKKKKKKKRPKGVDLSISIGSHARKRSIDRYPGMTISIYDAILVKIHKLWTTEYMTAPTDECEKHSVKVDGTVYDLVYNPKADLVVTFYPSGTFEKSHRKCSDEDYVIMFKKAYKRFGSNEIIKVGRLRKTDFFQIRMDGRLLYFAKENYFFKRIKALPSSILSSVL